MKPLLLTLLIMLCNRLSLLGENPVVPNTNVLGESILAPLVVFQEGVVIERRVYPEEIAIVMKSGRVNEIRAQYPADVSFESLQTEMDKKYGQWRLKMAEKVPLRVWRVLPQKFVVQLALNDDRKVILSYVEMTKK